MDKIDAANVEMRVFNEKKQRYEKICLPAYFLDLQNKVENIRTALLMLIQLQRDTLEDKCKLADELESMYQMNQTKVDNN